MDIFENGRKIGTIKQQREGLYTRLMCQVEPSETIRRLYLAYPYGSMYLGIPDETGYLLRRIVSKRLPQECCAVCAENVPEGYLPWRGSIDAVEIDAAFIGKNEILLPEEEAIRFPSRKLETKIIDDRQMAALRLNDEGVPQPREREATNEAFDFDDFDSGVHSALLADAYAGGSGAEADRADL